MNSSSLIQKLNFNALGTVNHSTYGMMHVGGEMGLSGPHVKLKLPVFCVYCMYLFY